MRRYKCPKCKGDQFSANPNRENEPCIYCGNEKTELMDTIEDEEVSGKDES